MAGRIVVGIDGSEGSFHALRWAIHEAECHRASLDVVAAWEYPLLGSAKGEGLLAAIDFGKAVDWSRVRAEAEVALAETIAGITSDTDVAVDTRLVEGNASEVLLEAAEGAELLVVGARGRGGFSALLLGSVSSQCVQHSPCPVVVVRAPEVSGS